MFQLVVVLLFLRLLCCENGGYENIFTLLNYLQTICLTPVTDSELPSLYGSIVCGAKPSYTDKLLFKQLGLYHILIVSGAHLTFLESFLNIFLKKRSYLKITLLIIYGSFCQLAPPILRAIMHLLLRKFIHKNRLFIKPPLQTIISGCLTILIFPEWLASYSLLISWTASLSLTLSKQKYLQCIYVYLLTYPILFSFAPQSPLVVLYNMTFGTLFSLFFFPFILVTYFIPPTYPWSAKIWNSFYHLLIELPSVQAQTLESEPLPLVYLWIYLLGIHTSIHIYKILGNTYE